MSTKLQLLKEYCSVLSRDSTIWFAPVNKQEARLQLAIQELCWLIEEGLHEELRHVIANYELSLLKTIEC